MKKALLLFVSMWLAAGSPGRAATPDILRFDEVRSGMKGTGRTVFRGTLVESFDVEILGTLPNVGPHQNLILGRCSGGPLAETGVLAGMSGSPVFVQGKLIGAVAYGWGFAKDAIAGITPIEEMLEVASRGRESGPSGSMRGAYEGIGLLREPDRLAAWFRDRVSWRLMPAGGLPAVLPVSVAGLDVSALSREAPGLFRSGLVPLQGAGAGHSPDPSPPLEPGSAVGLKLVRGDIDMTASGTATWVDGDGVLALGHPLFGLGSISLPLTGARVEVLVPSLDRSLRLATPLAEVGSLREDRAAGVFGRLGAAPRMIPVRIQASFRGSEQRTFSFDLADDPLLAPVLLYVSLNGILESSERVAGAVTLRLRDGSVIKTAGQEDVDLTNVFAGPSARYFATATTAFILHLLMNNDETSPHIEGVNLVLDQEDEPRTARLSRASVDRYRVRAGEDVEVTAVLRPFRGAEQVIHRTVTLPDETLPGPLTLHVGQGTVLSRSEAGDAVPAPRDLPQLISLINRVPRNDRLYVVASREDAGVFLGGERLPNLPPSVASMLFRPRSRGNFAVVPQRGLVEEQIPVDRQVEGTARVQIEVEAR